MFGSKTYPRLKFGLKFCAFFVLLVVSFGLLIDVSYNSYYMVNMKSANNIPRVEASVTEKWKTREQRRSIWPVFQHRDISRRSQPNLGIILLQLTISRKLKLGLVNWYTQLLRCGRFDWKYSIESSRNF